MKFNNLFEQYMAEASILEPVRQLVPKSSKIDEAKARVPDDVRKINVEKNIALAKERGIRTVGEFIHLFHGTSNANMKKIHKSGKLKNGTWFGKDFETSQLYAQRNHGNASGVDSMAVWAGVIMPSGDYWVSNEELYFKNGRYMPKDLRI